MPEAKQRVFGLLNIYKPSGPTSHDLVAWVRRGTRVKKVGHAGTLDPMATGVLVLCLGPATRLSEYVMRSPKTYVAQVTFGVETTTYDAEGAVVAQNPRTVRREEVEAALDRFRGTIEQIPPMFSAIKQGGRKLYELARSGEVVERPARMVTITCLDLVAWEPPIGTLIVSCSPGTYIRSLAHDLGQALGVGAHLSALERTASGAFTAESAVPWNAFEAAMEDGTWSGYVLPPDLAVQALPVVYLDAAGTEAVRNGRFVPVEPDVPPEASEARAYGHDGAFLAVLERRGNRWKPAKVFAP